MADLVVSGVNIPDRRTIELMRTELACVSRGECDRRCEDCDLVQDVDELIAAFREVIRVLEAVASAIQLPEGHGRLIDASALYRQLHSMYHGAISDSEIYVYEVLGMISNAPTIIPAEGGG